ncbi:hypothetical protein VNO77_28348 [Canavalia gladiata]|uniref:Uncharacterized protein n=1 Tax=Canavalia gladiata TaxID=3824 RepID=A0AAN9KVE9_CANGL
MLCMRVTCCSGCCNLLNDESLSHLVPSFHDKKCLLCYLFSACLASHAHQFQHQFLVFWDSNVTVLFKHDEET